ncbi:MAG: hypothetical protein H6623_08665 [Bdellovibrionaceae bacterium]|nr:hypothetical protein [Pseudobdellovibrionaceae bacterium]
MNILTASLFLSLTMWVSPAFSNTNQQTISPTETFALALKSFKTKDYAQSRKDFSILLRQHPSDPTLLYNAGLVEALDNHPARAFAYWRKALFFQPGHAPSLQGISQIRDSVTSPSLLMPVYWRIPIAWIFGFSILFWFLSGTLFILSLYRQHKGQNALWMPTILSTFLFVMTLTLALNGYWLAFDAPVGTIMASAPARSAPNAEAPSLFDFNEGDEVRVLRTQGNWDHVQKSATAVGWVPRTAVLRHSGI